MMSESYGGVIGFFAFVIGIGTAFAVYPYMGWGWYSFLMGPATGTAFWLVFFGIPWGRLQSLPLDMCTRAQARLYARVDTAFFY